MAMTYMSNCVLRIYFCSLRASVYSPHRAGTTAVPPAFRAPKEPAHLPVAPRLVIPSTTVPSGPAAGQHPPARRPSGASRSLPGRAPAPHTQGQRPGLGARGRGSSASGRHEPPVRGCPVMGSGAGPAGAPPAAGST